jgi:hypothetical protein
MKHLPVRVILPTLSRGWFGSRDQRLTVVALLAVLAAAALFTQVLRVDLKVQAARHFTPHESEVLYLPPAAVLEAASLGYPHFTADLLFIRCISYFVRHLFTDRAFPWLDLYLERVVALDRFNGPVYEWAMKVVKYRQLIDNGVIDESNEWARRGIQAFPDNWKYYLEIGFNDYFERQFRDEEDKAAWRKKAADWFMMASSLPGSRLDPNFVTSLYLQHNEKDMALFYALQRYHDATDAEKNMLLENVATLISEQAAHSLQAAEARWRANWPFLTPAMSDVLGGRLAAVPTPASPPTPPPEAP